MASHRVRTLAIVGASLAGALVVGWIADRASNAGPGALAGGMMGAALGCGAVAGWISPVAIGAVLGTLILLIIGPGYDDYNGITSPLGAIGGGVLGELWSWLFGRGTPCGKGSQSRFHEDDLA